MDTSSEDDHNESSMLHGEDDDEDNHVDEESLDDHTKEKKLSWNKTTLEHLVCSVRKRLSVNMQPYSNEKIDWPEIEAEVGMNQCEHQFNRLLAAVRHYRTMDEITTDMLTQLKTPEVRQFNKAVENNNSIIGKKKGKKNAQNPAYPKKPRGAYALYTAEMAQPPYNLSFKDIAAKWKKLAAEKKTKYAEQCQEELEQYISQMTTYLEQHPNDMEARSLRDAAAKNLRRKERESKKKLDNTSILKYLHNKSTNRTDTPGKQKSTLNESPAAESPKKRTFPDDASPIKSPKSSPKKKKTKHIEWTAEMMYVESKRGTYSESHPEYDNDEVERKLTRKFNKLSESKQAKYQRLADDKNTS